MSVLKIKNENGKWVGIDTIKGEKGDKGDPGGVSSEEFAAVGEAVADAKTKAEDALAQLHEHQADKNNPHGITAEQIGAATAGHTHSASEVGAASEGHTHTASEIGVATAEWTTLADVTVGTKTSSEDFSIALSEDMRNYSEALFIVSCVANQGAASCTIRIGNGQSHYFVSNETPVAWTGTYRRTALVASWKVFDFGGEVGIVPLSSDSYTIQTATVPLTNIIFGTSQLFNIEAGTRYIVLAR